MAAAVAALLVVVHGQQTTSTLVLPDVVVIDGTGAPPRPAMTLVVRDGRIADLFPTGDRPVPANARVLATHGRFVVPGFIDAHVHLAATPRPVALVRSLLRATLLGGVTTVRDMGGNGVVVADLAAAAERPGASSPAILRSAVFAGAGSFWFADPSRTGYLHADQRPGTTPWLVEIGPTTDIREAVRRAKAWGASGIQVHSRVTARDVRRIADEARRERLPVWAHATIGPATPGDVVEARVATISHATGLVWQGRTELPAPPVAGLDDVTAAMAVVGEDDRALRELWPRMRARQIALEPTLYIAAQAALFATDDRPQIERQIAWAAGVTARALAQGVTIITGTDAIGGSSPNLHAELQLLVGRAGLTPLQALRAATADAARAIGLGDETGRVAVGYRADLVVLAANPADDIRNTQTVQMVLRRGEVFERDEPMPNPLMADPPEQRGSER